MSKLKVSTVPPRVRNDSEVSGISIEESGVKKGSSSYKINSKVDPNTNGKRGEKRIPSSAPKHPDYAHVERTSSISYKAPSLKKKKAASPEVVRPQSTLSAAIGYFTSPVRYIGSFFTSRKDPTAVMSAPNLNKENVKHIKTMSSSTAQVKESFADILLESDPEILHPTVTLSNTVMKGTASTIKSKKTDILKSSVNKKSHGKKYSSSNLKISVSQISKHSLKPKSPTLQKKTVQSKPVSLPEPITVSSVKILSSSKSAFKVTSKAKEEQPVVTKKEVQKKSPKQSKHHFAPTLTSAVGDWHSEAPDDKNKESLKQDSDVKKNSNTKVGIQGKTKYPPKLKPMVGRMRNYYSPERPIIIQVSNQSEVNPTVIEPPTYLFPTVAENDSSVNRVENALIVSLSGNNLANHSPFNPFNPNNDAVLCDSKSNQSSQAFKRTSDVLASDNHYLTESLSLKEVQSIAVTHVLTQREFSQQPIKTSPISYKYVSSSQDSKQNPMGYEPRTASPIGYRVTSSSPPPNHTAATAHKSGSQKSHSTSPSRKSKSSSSNNSSTSKKQTVSYKVSSPSNKTSSPKQPVHIVLPSSGSPSFKVMTTPEIYSYAETEEMIPSSTPVLKTNASPSYTPSGGASPSYKVSSSCSLESSPEASPNYPPSSIGGGSPTYKVSYASVGNINGNFQPLPPSDCKGKSESNNQIESITTSSQGSVITPRVSYRVVSPSKHLIPARDHTRSNYRSVSRSPNRSYTDSHSSIRKDVAKLHSGSKLSSVSGRMNSTRPEHESDNPVIVVMPSMKFKEILGETKEKSASITEKIIASGNGSYIVTSSPPDITQVSPSNGLSKVSEKSDSTSDISLITKSTEQRKDIAYLSKDDALKDGFINIVEHSKSITKMEDARGACKGIMLKSSDKSPSASGLLSNLSDGKKKKDEKLAKFENRYHFQEIDYFNSLDQYGGNPAQHAAAATMLGEFP